MSETKPAPQTFEYWWRFGGHRATEQIARDAWQAATAAAIERCARLCLLNDERWDAIGGDGGASIECADLIRALQEPQS